MNNLHPHHREEIELQEFHALGLSYADKMEAQMGARWNNNWQDEFILTSRDVWVRNLCYNGPASLVHPADDYGHEDISQEAWDEWSAAYAAYWEDESIWQAQLEEQS
jgi:hypothetical protein